MAYLLNYLYYTTAICALVAVISNLSFLSEGNYWPKSKVYITQILLFILAVKTILDTIPVLCYSLY